MKNKYPSTSILTVLASVGVFLLGTFLGAIIESQYEKWVMGDVLQSNLWVLASILIFLALTISLLVALLNLTSRLYNKVGIKVRYVDVEESGEVYRSFTNVIRKAEKSIRVVNSHLVEGDMSIKVTSQSREARNLYYDLLLEKARTVQYHRLVQVSPDERTLADLKIYNRELFNHCKKMVEERDGNPKPNSNIYLLKCPATRVTTFVLVDKTHLIWQINEVDFADNVQGKLNLHGAFIIHDPMNRITRHFIDYFQRLENKGTAQVKYSKVKDELF